MSFSSLVNLYRKCRSPDSSRATGFASEVNYMEVKTLIDEIRGCSSIGRFDTLSVDGVEIDLDDDLPTDGVKVSFEYILSRGDSFRFYSSYIDLIEAERVNLSRGEMPSVFYLMGSDYFSDDGQEPPAEIQLLDDVCSLIYGLFRLAHYHDRKQGNSNPKLVFIGPSKNSEIKTIEIETKVSAELLKGLEPLDLQIVKELSADNAANDPHYSAKVGVFGTSLAGFVGSRQSGGAFEYLLRNWSEFSKAYHRDLSIYLSGFAFHKAKLEVAEAELKIANEFSKVLNDILGKLLGIPVSFAAVLAINKGDGIVKQAFVVLGIAVACWILSRVVANQQRQFKRIESSKDIVIGAMEGKKESYPPELQTEIAELSRALGENSNFLRGTLRGFWVLSWLPLVTAIGYLLYIYCNELLSCFLRLSAALGYGT